MKVTSGEDKVTWIGATDDRFSVHAAFKLLQPGVVSSFPTKDIWVPSVPTKSTFFCVGSNLWKSAYFGQASKEGVAAPKQMLLMRLR